MNDESALVAPPDKYFYTIDGKILTNIYQLSEYLKNCSTAHFIHHASPVRNDFYNWISNVFSVSELANKIEKNYDKNDIARIIDEFIVESKREKMSKIIETPVVERPPENKSVEEKPVENKSVENKFIEEKKDIPAESIKTDDAKKDDKFREFSDEELEKFTKFGIKDKDTPADEKLDYLKTELNELRNMIKELRKMGRDMILAELMLRVIDPKITFYDFTKNHDDYEKIINIMNDVRREIDYAGQQTETTIADEVIKQLELQRIMLKKDLTPRKQGVLGKIFKPANQEA